MRTCEVDNCVQPVFGTDKNTGIGYCQNHQWKRTDKKPKKIAMHAKGERIRDFSFGFDNQTDLFNWLWEDAQNEKGEVFCKYTGEKLNRFYNTEMWFSCFSHVLPKGKYTYWKLNPKNIDVVFPEFHRIEDQGTSIDRANHPTWRFDLRNARVEEMRIQYALFKKQNLLA
jgi:hypothetical protein